MFLDEQYIRMMGPRLDRFKPLSRNRYQCRCPICGDSKKDKKKARGNFYIYRGDWMYKCHNCGKALGIPIMLKEYFPDLYDEYLMGKKRTRPANKSTTLKTRIDTTLNPIVNDAHKTIVIDLPKLSDLPPDHPAVSYTTARLIPAKYFSDLYYAENFKLFANEMAPDTFESVKYDDSRIVIPFRDLNGDLFAFQGRALGPSKIKYLTVKLQEKQKIFGLDRIDLTKPIFVVEGPFDSFFLDNCLGTADSSLDNIDLVQSDLTFIWDNEPRSPIIVRKIEQAINNGSSVVIWKKSNSFNDINDAILYHKYSIAQINDLVKRRTYSGMLALVELNNWRKS